MRGSYSPDVEEFREMSPVAWTVQIADGSMDKAGPWASMYGGRIFAAHNCMTLTCSGALPGWKIPSNFFCSRNKLNGKCFLSFMNYIFGTHCTRIRTNSHSHRSTLTDSCTV